MRMSAILAAGIAASMSAAAAGVGPTPGQGQIRARQRDAERRKEVRERATSAGMHKNLPGETNRQLAARLRTDAANTTVEAPAKPKRVRTKKEAA